MEGSHRPNSEEGQLYTGTPMKEPAYQQQWHQSCSLFNTCSAYLGILCLCMESLHSTIKYKLEMVQRRAARYCTTRYHNTWAASQICYKIFNGYHYESRRMKIQLMLFKIINDLVDFPAEEYLMPASTWTTAWKLRPYPTKTDTFKFSFFPRTIPAWNSLPATIAEAPDLVHSKRGLSTLIF